MSDVGVKGGLLGIGRNARTERQEAGVVDSMIVERLVILRI
jgi:hypothetical protein